MRIALISDIHGNKVALDAVLADIRAQNIDSLVCLGDVATLGPQPVEVLRMLKRLDCVFILGNHDSSILEPVKALEYKIAPFLIPTFEWCLPKLSEDDFEFLHSFTPTYRLALGNGDEMFCYHGSPKSNIDNIFSETPPNEVDKFLNGHTAKVMAGGHTHIQMLRQHNGRMIINPGSVGNVFLAPPKLDTQPTLLPWAEYAIVNWQDGQVSAEFKRVAYNIERLYQTIRDSSIPLKDWLLTQFKWPI
ncbi:MAG: metallophosphoesterase family protein [Chloroflexi bacterium]|nr:metallophosphoesterase family protein [Chloroflexota bacterium]